MVNSQVTSTTARLEVLVRRDEASHRNCLLLNGADTGMVEEALDRYCAGWGVKSLAALASSAEQTRTIPLHAFGAGVPSFARLEPVVGRRYPARLLSDAPAGRPSFLVTSVTDDSVELDFGHPLRGLPVAVSVTEERTAPALSHRREPWLDQKLFRWLDMGPGLQLTQPVSIAGLESNPTFAREDETDDAVFYSSPRMVQHIDSWARDTMASVVSEQLPPAARVVDLMSSWVTHLPAVRDDLSIYGLGMNEEELRSNPRLSQFFVRNLNDVPSLPLEPASLDAVICAVSVEYLKRPIGIFRAVRDALKPGGVFINAFSDRCFPTKAVQLWAQLHPFERMAFVSGCHEAASGYGAASTFTLAGAPRPPDDDYAMQMPDADAVYAVWARKR